MLQHHCAVYLNAVIMGQAKEQGGRPLGDAEYVQDTLTTEGTEYIVPEVIQEYVRITTTNGEDVYLNVPDIAVPQPATEDHESGFFGPCTAENYNIYECYVSPAVTERCAIVNDNDIEELHGEGRSRLNGLHSPTGDTVKHGYAARVNTYLRSITDKSKSLTIPWRTTLRTGLVFVETNMTYQEGLDSPALGIERVNLYSYIPFAAQTANHAYLGVYHRRRVRTARGLCYTRENGAALPGWNASINANFNREGPFAPTTIVDFPSLRAATHASHTGTRQRVTKMDKILNFPRPSPVHELRRRVRHEYGGGFATARRNHLETNKFFSKAFTDSQKKFSAYDRELLSIYQALRHFKFLVEGRQLTIFTRTTNHCHNMTYAYYALTQKPDTMTPKRIRYLNFIRQYSTDIQHIASNENPVADALNWVDELSLTEGLGVILDAQSGDCETKHLLENKNLKLRFVKVPGLENPLLCDYSTSG
ncbi:Hypothetical protein NTJ_14623 [Nesidiocoris tenuis]|uniref:Reverse transcriptase/retrotransposon-derived protein RNase H-like domain-containing protein n=1 Tax=Nesidiocoris tenuis TaxID=355587 RepID=A0ABN7BBQ9_9HEMI|nr:Hypothetical protein NTJ_14623 [Nesidiocoris tenuis]